MTKKIIILLIFFTLLISSSYGKNLNGNGNVDLSKKTFNYFYNYISQKEGKGIFFAISNNGNFSNYIYCPSHIFQRSSEIGNPSISIKGIISKCEKISKTKCFVFARGQKIVWNKKNIKISKKINKEELYDKLVSLSFMESVNYINKNQSRTQQNNIADQLIQLNKLFKNGAISKKENIK